MRDRNGSNLESFLADEVLSSIDTAHSCYFLLRMFDIALLALSMFAVRLSALLMQKYSLFPSYGLILDSNQLIVILG
jgi:hypothetical protein